MTELAFRKHTEEEEGNWLSISDLMAGLMVLFLFIAIVYIRPLVQTQLKIEQVATTWVDARERIYQALEREFRNDLRLWDAELEKETLTIRFRAPDILFETGAHQLNDNFKKILRSFFPRYVIVLSEFQNELDEVRIEGHTSSEWAADTTEFESYFKNMELSQARTRSVLEYAFAVGNVYDQFDWIKSKMTANGLSFSRPILNRSGGEDSERSRRVEFRIRTNTEDKIQDIIGNLE